jgi:hypothetical protein
MRIYLKKAVQLHINWLNNVSLNLFQNNVVKLSWHYGAFAKLQSQSWLMWKANLSHFINCQEHFVSKNSEAINRNMTIGCLNHSTEKWVSRKILEKLLFFNLWWSRSPLVHIVHFTQVFQNTMTDVHSVVHWMHQCTCSSNILGMKWIFGTSFWYFGLVGLSVSMPILHQWRHTTNFDEWRTTPGGPGWSVSNV